MKKNKNKSEDDLKEGGKSFKCNEDGSATTGSQSQVLDFHIWKLRKRQKLVYELVRLCATLISSSWCAVE